MLKILLAVSFCLLSLAGCVSMSDPGTAIDEYVVMERPIVVREICSRLPSPSIECVQIGRTESVHPISGPARNFAAALTCKNGSGRLSGAPTSFLDGIYTRGICGKIYLKQRDFGDGVMLYTAQLAIAKTPGDPTLLASVIADNGAVYNKISSYIPMTPAGSPEATQYIAEAKQALATRQRENAEKAAAEARQAIEARRIAAQQASDAARVSAIRAAAEQKAARDREAYARSPEAKQKKAVDAIHQCRQHMLLASAALERERKISQLSGVESMSVNHRAGAIIVDCSEIISHQFAIYKENGGIASTPDEIQ